MAGVAGTGVEAGTDVSGTGSAGTGVSGTRSAVDIAVESKMGTATRHDSALTMTALR